MYSFEDYNKDFEFFFKFCGEMMKDFKYDIWYRVKSFIVIFED